MDEGVAVATPKLLGTSSRLHAPDKPGVASATLSVSSMTGQPLSGEARQPPSSVRNTKVDPVAPIVFVVGARGV